jgi:hypothetical protein
MRSAAIAGWLVLLSISGCQSIKSPPTSAPSTADKVAAPAEVDSQSRTAGPPAAASPLPAADASLPVVAPPVSSDATTNSAKSKPTSGARAAKQPGPASPAVVAPPLKSNNSPAAATLDLAELETRLKDTHAIGVFTKLSLKNQVDDLLDEFRLFYKGSRKNPSVELRQHYDVLLVKVLSLLKDGDPALAAAVSSSREAIWAILADPDKFAKL